MALNKAKRSVLFNKGIADGTDRFLLEPPAIDYAENLTLGKDGSFSKRMGFDQLAATGTPPQGEILFMREIGGNLHVLTDQGVSSLINGQWQHRAVSAFVASSSVEVETQVYAGMSSADHFALRATPGGDIIGYVVAIEIRESASRVSSKGTIDREDIKTHILFQRYSEQGKFLSQTKISNAISPRFVSSTESDDCFLYYVDIASSTLRSRYFFGATGFLTLAAPYPATDVNLFFATRSHGYTMNQTRLPASWDGIGRYDIVRAGNYHACVRRGLDNHIYVDTITPFDVVADTENLYTPVGVDAVYEVKRAEPLAIHAIGNEVYILWTEHSTFLLDKPGIPSLLHVSKYSINSGTGALTGPTTTIVENPNALSDPDSINGGFTYSHGAMASYGVLLCWVAHKAGNGVDATVVGEPEKTIDWNAVRDPKSGLTIGLLNTAAMTPEPPTRPLAHHRLASKPMFLADGTLVLAAQQWFDATPEIPETLPDNYGYAGVAGAQAPKTTVLCAIDILADDPIVTAFAYVDANQSLFSEYAVSEFAKHTPFIIQDGEDLLILNRVVLGAEDLNIRFDDARNEDEEVRLGNLESPSESLYRIHRIARGSGARPIEAVALGDGFVVNTALPMWFDGRWIGELSPIDAPQIVKVTDKRWIGRGIDLPILDYEYGNKGDDRWRKMNVIGSYSDHYGNIHRSAPSVTLWVDEITGADAAEGELTENGYPIEWVGSHVTVYFTRPLSMLPQDLQYSMEIYASATDVDGAGGDVSDPLLIDATTLEGRSLLSGNSYNALISLVRYAGGPENRFEDPPRTSKTLYSNAGLAADTWPAFTHAVATSTRLWAIDAVNQGRVIASKLFEDFISPEYNPTLAINLGDERNLTAIGKLDDKVVVFEPNDIHVIYGDGPDNRGQGQDFAVHYITTDVGCSDQKSLIETPAGLIFYSAPRGFYLLDRNLQIQFIGAGIEDIARGIRIKDATIDPANAEVRFLVEPDPNTTQTEKYGSDADTTLVTRPPRPVFGNPLPADACLVFYYESGDWMLYTNYPGVASCLYQQRYTKILSDGSVWQESDGYSDPTGENRTLMRSPWIKLSETIQDFQRLWYINFLGRYKSSLQDLGSEVYEAGDVIVRLYFDYEANYAQEERFRMQDFGFDPFDRVPQRPERFQFSVFPVRGRCQAIKIEIEEVNSEDQGEGLTYGLGAGFEIVSADLSVGVSPIRALLPKGVRA